MSERYVYVTKYALTDGICRCEFVEGSGKRWLVVKWPGWSNSRRLFARRDASESLDDAQARVREMAVAKLKSLDKQRAKLEKIARDEAKVQDG